MFPYPSVRGPLTHEGLLSPYQAHWIFLCISNSSQSTNFVQYYGKKDLIPSRWSFTDPGPTRTAFSTMSSTSGNRKKFITGLIQFMDTYGFDGVDLDWEYPQAEDRGGSQGDTANYVQLVKDMRAAFGTKYGITVTLPTSYWYLQHFDLPGMQSSVDWFNLMSYDCKSKERGLSPATANMLP